MTSEIVTLDYLFLGHPRCGSAALAAGLSEAGLSIGHENPGASGMVSWWHTGFYEPDKEPHHFKKSSKNKPAFMVDKIFHYLRRPADALPSIIVENEHGNRDNNSFNHRRRVLWQHFKVDINKMSPQQAATASYVLWNRLAASISDAVTPILVERPDLSIISTDLHADALPVRNTTEEKYGLKKNHSDLEYFLIDTTTEYRDAIEAIERLYS